MKADVWGFTAADMWNYPNPESVYFYAAACLVQDCITINFEADNTTN